MPNCKRTNLTTSLNLTLNSHDLIFVDGDCRGVFQGFWARFFGLGCWRFLGFLPKEVSVGGREASESRRGGICDQEARSRGIERDAGRHKEKEWRVKRGREKSGERKLERDSERCVKLLQDLHLIFGGGDFLSMRCLDLTLNSKPGLKSRKGFTVAFIIRCCSFFKPSIFDFFGRGWGRRRNKLQQGGAIG